ncbi:MAG: hypothetical protein GY799_27180 [Desulfobulbaceae bacterium]|nr:hypothetical protein [Desulfobulbaceae bacterium]
MENSINEAEKTKDELSSDVKYQIEKFMFAKFVKITTVLSGLLGFVGFITGFYLNDITTQKTKNDIYDKVQQTILDISNNAASSAAIADRVRKDLEKELMDLEQITKTVEKDTIDKLAQKFKDSPGFKTEIKEEMLANINQLAQRVSSVESQTSNTVKDGKTIKSNIQTINQTLQKQEISIASLDGNLKILGKLKESLKWIEISKDKSSFNLSCEYKIVMKNPQTRMDETKYPNIITPNYINVSFYRESEMVQVYGQNKDEARKGGIGEKKPILINVKTFKRCLDS